MAGCGTTETSVASGTEPASKVEAPADDQPEPAASADRIVNAACPGNIYLLHAVSQTNADILPEVIDRVRDAGYTWGDPAEL